MLFLEDLSRYLLRTILLKKLAGLFCELNNKSHNLWCLLNRRNKGRFTNIRRTKILVIGIRTANAMLMNRKIFSAVQTRLVHPMAEESCLRQLGMSSGRYSCSLTARGTRRGAFGRRRPLRLTPRKALALPSAPPCLPDPTRMTCRAVPTTDCCLLHLLTHSARTRESRSVDSRLRPCTQKQQKPVPRKVCTVINSISITDVSSIFLFYLQSNRNTAMRA